MVVDSINEALPQQEYMEPIASIQANVDTMLNTLLNYQLYLETKDENKNLTEETPSPHRFSGDTTLAQTSSAVRELLSKGSVPKYRTVTYSQEEEKPETTPQKPIELHLFTEVGPYADLDQQFKQILAAISLWNPNRTNTVNLILHPIDRGMNFLKMRPEGSEAVSLSTIIDTKSDSGKRMNAIKNLYRQARATQEIKPEDLALRDDSFIKTLEIPLGSTIRNIDKEATGQGKTPVFAAIFDINFNLKEKYPINSTLPFTNNVYTGFVLPSQNGLGTFTITKY